MSVIRKKSHTREDEDRMASTQSSSQSDNSCDEHTYQSKRKKSNHEGCRDCHGGHGKSRTCCWIDIRPLCRLLVAILTTIVGWTKYYFYALAATLYPAAYYRYFIRFGITPFNDWTCLLTMCIAAFFCVMAVWSHSVASAPRDPGYMDWDDFRSEEDRIKNKEDR